MSNAVIGSLKTPTPATWTSSRGALVAGLVAACTMLAPPSSWASPAQATVQLNACFVADAVHGTQAIGGPDPVAVGIPARLHARFEFSLQPSLQQPGGGFAVPEFGLLWRVNDPQAGPLHVQELEQGQSYVPEHWLRAPAEHRAIQLLRFNKNTGSGVCQVDIPLGRALPDRLYPYLNATQGDIDLAVGLAKHLHVDAQTHQPVGVLFVSHLSFPTAAPAFVVDIFNPRSFLGEPCLAAVVSREATSADRVLDLRSSVQGMLYGLPDSVILPAGERMIQIAYLPLFEGTYQIEVFQAGDGSLLGYSTLAHTSPLNDLPPGSTGAGAGGAASTLHPSGFSPATQYATDLPLVSDLEYRHLMDDLFPEHVWVGECEPVRIYERNAGDHCGECHMAPLTEAEKPDCPEDLLFYWRHRCTGRYVNTWDDPVTICEEFSELKELNAYRWTGSRGEYTCANAELSFGRRFAATIGVSFVKSCCTYRRVPGETAEGEVPNCRTKVLY